VVFLGPRANAELVPKFHVALHASHAGHCLGTFQTAKLCFDYTPLHEGGNAVWNVFCWGRVEYFRQCFPTCEKVLTILCACFSRRRSDFSTKVVHMRFTTTELALGQVRARCLSVPLPMIVPLVHLLIHYPVSVQLALLGAVARKPLSPQYSINKSSCVAFSCCVTRGCKQNDRIYTEMQLVKR
jgi:hypothetical protein